jgi:ribosomal protein S18 acetylase RimI-like enzyme
MRIRPALEADHAALAELFLLARRDSFTWEDAAAFKLEDFAVQTEGEVIHLAEEEEGGELLGFLSVWEPESFVHHLFIAPGHRRRGVGRALLSDLQWRMPGPFRLKCVAANEAALAFYRRLGWVATGHGSADDKVHYVMEWGPLPDGFARRPATREDMDFLWGLHVLTMRNYVEQTWGWERVWQEENFRAKFDIAGLEILEIEGRAIGAMAVKEEPERLFLREIAIHPDWQGLGIGSALVKEVMATGGIRGLPARLQVLKVNPARRLYERCGFRLSGETETHHRMEFP